MEEVSVLGLAADVIVPEVASDGGDGHTLVYCRHLVSIGAKTIPPHYIYLAPSDATSPVCSYILRSSEPRHCHSVILTKNPCLLTVFRHFPSADFRVRGKPRSSIGVRGDDAKALAS